jgi:hypothetical protein
MRPASKLLYLSVGHVPNETGSVQAAGQGHL